MRAFLTRHALAAYFVLAFAISWACVLVIAGGPGGFPAPTDQATTLLPLAVSAMLLGPSVAGLLLTGLVHGKAGLRELVSRSLRWRVGARWYAVALLATPLLATAVLLALLPTSPVYVPGIVASGGKGSLLLTGIAVGLFAGLFEEPGWTGFAIPALRRRHGILATGLIVGFLWGAWHYIVAFWGSGDATGTFTLPLFLAQMSFYVAVLPAYRVLMVWVHDKTRSLLVAILMHASLTGTVLFILMPPGIPDVPLMTWYLGLAALLWIAVAVIGVGSRRARR